MVTQQRNTGFNFNKPNYSLDTLTLSTPQFRSGADAPQGTIDLFKTKYPRLSKVIGYVTIALLGGWGGINLEKIWSYYQTEAGKKAAEEASELANNTKLNGFSKTIISCADEQIEQLKIGEKLTDNSRKLFRWLRASKPGEVVKIAGKEEPIYRTIAKIATPKDGSNSCPTLAEQINDRVKKSLLADSTVYGIQFFIEPESQNAQEFWINPDNKKGFYTLFVTPKPESPNERSMNIGSILPQEGFNTKDRSAYVNLEIKSATASKDKPNQ
jgi:hypothetical protein